MRSEHRWRHRDAGMVTAELAACLPVLVLVLGVALSAVAIVSARVRVLDAAREAARAAARSDGSAARRLVGEIAPGARSTVTRGSATTSAVVTLAVHPLTGLLPAITVSGRAVAATEPDPVGAGP
jgi:Flp pilus assembly protein TadG